MANAGLAGGSKSPQQTKTALVVGGLFGVAMFLIVAVVGILAIGDNNISVRDAQVTNVTDTAFTLTWVSESPYVGSVVYQEGSSWPMLFAQSGKMVAFDDRDVELDKDGNYVTVESGAKERFTHHVTIRNLKPDTEYSFRVGGRINGKDAEITTATTRPLIEDIKTPDPGYGKVEGVEGDDSLITFASVSQDPIILSTVVSKNNTYSLDVSRLAETTGGAFDATKFVVNIQNQSDAILPTTFVQSSYKPFETILYRVNLEVRDEPLGSILGTVSAGGCATEYVVVSSGRLNVRKVPNTIRDSGAADPISTPVGVITPGTIITGCQFTISSAQYGETVWLQLEDGSPYNVANGEIAVVAGSARYIAPAPVAPQQASQNSIKQLVAEANVNLVSDQTCTARGQWAVKPSATSQNINVRGRPGINHPVVSSISSDTVGFYVYGCVQPIGANGGSNVWYELYTNSDGQLIGYVASGVVRLVATATPQTLSPDTILSVGGELEEGRNANFTPICSSFGEANHVVITRANENEILGLLGQRVERDQLSVGAKQIDDSYVYQRIIRYDGTSPLTACIKVGPATETRNTVVKLAATIWQKQYVFDTTNDTWVTSGVCTQLASGTELPAGTGRDNLITLVNGGQGSWTLNNIGTNTAPSYVFNNGRNSYFASRIDRGSDGVVGVVYFNSEAYCEDTIIVDNKPSSISVPTPSTSAVQILVWWKPLDEATRTSSGTCTQWTNSVDATTNGNLQLIVNGSNTGWGYRAGFGASGNKYLISVNDSRPDGGRGIVYFSNEDYCNATNISNGAVVNPQAYYFKTYPNSNCSPGTNGTAGAFAGNCFAATPAEFAQFGAANINLSAAITSEGLHPTLGFIRAYPTRAECDAARRAAANICSSTTASAPGVNQSRQIAGFSSLVKPVSAATPASREAMQPRVLGAGSDQSLEVTESGRYAFFRDGERIAEQDVVVQDGQIQVRLFADNNRNGIKDADEEYFSDYSQISIAKEASAEEFSLTTGWNLIHLPLIDTRTDGNVGTAGNLIDYWNGQGADIKHVARYRNGQFQMFSKRESGTEYSTDFDLIPGEGLFILNLAGNTNVTFSGNRFESSVPVRLNQGWNLVGIMAPGQSLKSEDVLKKAQSQGLTADTISQFEGGTYQSVISKDDTMFGNNFNIVDKRGYFIRVESGGGRSFDPGK